MNKQETSATPPFPGRARREPALWGAEALFFEVNGERVAADPAGVLWWPERETLVVADMHFEKGSSYARRGVFLPPYDTRETIRKLSDAMARLEPSTVVSLGDAFHDKGAEARLDEEDEDALAALTSRADWVWIAGNHDPAPPKRFRGMVCEQLSLGKLMFRHEPTAAGAPGEVSGHLHPVAKVSRPGRSVRRRCFATDGRKLVLPAFGAYTGGLNVLDAAFQPVFEGALTALMLGAGRVYPVAGRELIAD